MQGTTTPQTNTVKTRIAQQIGYNTGRRTISSFELKEDGRFLHLSYRKMKRLETPSFPPIGVHENTYALVVSTESVTENLYRGNNRAMLVINCFFRVGGTAILVSNLPSSAPSSKYLISRTVHTHTAGSNPPSYTCIHQEEDSEGSKGVTVTKDLLSCASAIQANLVTLGPLILPFKAQLLYLARKLLALHAKSDFNEAIEHFLPHVGGRPVLDEIARSLKMTGLDMEASTMTLYRFGNTSSSSIWYELAYAEAKGRVKKGDRVWQLAFGSGFKCSSVVWTDNWSVGEKELGNPWADEIDEFPVDDSGSEIMLRKLFLTSYSR